MRIDLIVTDDKALITYLYKSGICGPDVPVIYPAAAMDVIGKNVIGHLPHMLSCVALSYTEIPVHLPPSLVGQKLILRDYDMYADAPMTYITTRYSEVVE